MNEEREIQFVELFPRPSSFVRWIVDLNTIAHAVEAIDYTEDISVTSPEVDNLLSCYMIFCIRNSDQIHRCLKLLEPEILNWKELNKEKLKNENNQF